VLEAIQALLVMFVVADVDVVARVRRHVAVELVTEPATYLPGKYAPQAMLGGHELHLFADYTYIYAVWGCVEPLTIHDKGKWTVFDSTLRLVSDTGIRWEPDVDREYVMLRRPDRPDELVLMGMVRPRRILDAIEGRDAAAGEQVLLFLGLPRVARYGARDGSKARSLLLKESWRPEQFGRVH
jgi:hypothetical protein